MNNNFEEFIKKHSQTEEKTVGFVEYLYGLMDKYGYDKSSDLYNKAGISRILLL